MSGQLTSIALPTTSLLELRDLWETGDDEALRSQSLELIRDLFGGIDGHLTRIDAALPTGEDTWVELHTAGRGFDFRKDGYHVVSWRGSQWGAGQSSRVQLAKAREEVERLAQYGGYTRVDIYRRARHKPGARLGTLEVRELVESKVLV